MTVAYFLDIISALVTPEPSQECSWDRYCAEMNIWKRHSGAAKEYLATERGRMALAALAEHTGRRPSLKKINATAWTIDRDLHRALLTLQAYRARKIGMRQSITARVEYVDEVAPTRTGIFTRAYSTRWYQSNWQ